MGTHTTRIGYAGEDTPKSVDFSVSTSKFKQVGVLVDDQRIVTGQKLSYHWQNNEIHPLLTEQGYVVDWDRFEVYLQESLRYLSIKETESPILFSEPSIPNKENRKQIVEIMFEKLKVPCFFILKSGVLSAFSCGKSTCLVLDMGQNHSSAIPIHEGYILNKSIQKENYGG